MKPPEKDAGTSIWISSDTKKKLEELKPHPRASYDEVVRDLLAKVQALELKLKEAEPCGTPTGLEESA